DGDHDTTVRPPAPRDHGPGRRRLTDGRRLPVTVAPSGPWCEGGRERGPSSEEHPMNVTIVGAGNMARGIGTRVLAGGHTLRLHDRTKAKAEELASALGEGTAGAGVSAVDADRATDADVVVLALPYPAGRDIAEAW